MEAELRSALAEHDSVMRTVKEDAQKLLEENAALAAALKAQAEQQDTAASEQRAQQGERDAVVQDLMQHIQQQSTRLRHLQVCARSRGACVCPPSEQCTAQ